MNAPGMFRAENAPAYTIAGSADANYSRHAQVRAAGVRRRTACKDQVKYRHQVESIGSERSEMRKARSARLPRQWTRCLMRRPAHVMEAFLRSTILLFLAVLLLPFASAGEAQADRRVALVIGNGDYQYADKLANPVTDARNMRDALT